jgi:RNA polymerase sigma-70 factor (ECF subfamily)
LDDEEFRRLVMPSASATLRLATALVGATDAEDVVQEAFERAWRGWPTLRDPAAIHPWLLRITTNVCHDWQRGRIGSQRRRTEPLHAGEDTSALPLGAIATAVGTYEHVTALDLRHAINELADDLRLAVVLRYYAGLDASEIALVVNSNASTIRTRLQRALMLLRTRLEAAGRPLSRIEESRIEERS